MSTGADDAVMPAASASAPAKPSISRLLSHSPQHLGIRSNRAASILVVGHGSASPQSIVPDRAHATRASYQAGCRCVSCRSANAAYEVDYRRLKAEGRSSLGIRIPAARTHILMKVIRGEHWSNHRAGRDLFGSYRAYCKVRRASRVTLRTALRVGRFYRQMVLEPGESSSGMPCVTK